MTPGDRWFFRRVAWFYGFVVPRMGAGALGEALALADGPVERVLDVGGGTGRAARAIEAPERVVLDATLEMLQRSPPDIDAVLATATDLPVADGSADAVVIVDALHHLPRHHRVFAEAHRALRPGGVLVVREFNRATLRGRLLEAAEHAVGMGSTFRTAEALRDRVAAAGFEGAAVLDGGVSCTVAGRKPSGTDGPEPGGP